MDSSVKIWLTFFASIIFAVLFFMLISYLFGGIALAVLFAIFTGYVLATSPRRNSN